MAFEIRPAERRDFDNWMALRQAVYTGLDDSFHLEEVELYHADKEKQCLLAFNESGEVAGMIELSLRNVVDGCLTSPVGYVEGIYVCPAFRGRGLASQLLLRGEAWCLEKGCQEIATDAELDNEEAQAFHRRMGFEETYRVVEFRKNLQ